jgi:hypothetical protein
MSVDRKSTRDVITKWIARSPEDSVKRTAEFGVKWPKGVAKITDDQEALRSPTTFGRSLAASEDYQPQSVHFCSGEGEDECDEGTGIEGGGLDDSLQIDGRRRREVEEANRLSTGGIDAGWSEVRERGAGRRR